MEHEFVFHSLQGAEAVPLNGTSNIRNICEETGSRQWKKELVLTFGRLLTLFGPPLYTTKDMEDEYSYRIRGEGKHGAVVHLEVYYGPSGPAIGGKQGDLERQAADELAELILATPPSDYEYTGYYMDGPCLVHKSVKNGQPFSKERELTEKELEAAEKELDAQ